MADELTVLECLDSEEMADAQREFEKPILIDIITAAAPYAPAVGKPCSRELLRARIHRILQIAAELNYHSLVLGAGAVVHSRTILDLQQKILERP